MMATPRVLPPGFNWRKDWWIPMLAGIVAIVVERILITRWPVKDLVERAGGHL